VVNVAKGRQEKIGQNASPVLRKGESDKRQIITMRITAKQKKPLLKGGRDLKKKASV
jgi:hypothetical protein